MKIGVDKMEVVCGIIHKDGKYLIAKRGKGVDEGIWEFPGGKVEAHETKEMAVIRELQEELDVSVHVDSYVATIEDHHSDEIIYVSAFLCTIIQGNPSLHVHDEIKWVSAKDLYKFSFQKDDLKILDALQDIKF